MRSIILAAAALIGVAATAPAAQSGSPAAQSDLAGRLRLDRLIGSRVAGAPVTCVPLRQATRSQVVPGEAIVYSQNSGRLFVNRPSGGAEWLTPDAILVSDQRIGQICRGDPVQIVDRASRIQRGFVTLGDFVPYTRR